MNLYKPLGHSALSSSENISSHVDALKSTTVKMNKIFGIAFIFLVIKGSLSVPPQSELQTIISFDRDYVPIPYGYRISGWRNNQYQQPTITTTTSEDITETTPKPKGWKRGSGTYRRDYPYGYGNQYGKGWKLRTGQYYR